MSQYQQRLRNLTAPPLTSRARSRFEPGLTTEPASFDWTAELTGTGIGTGTGTGEAEPAEPRPAKPLSDTGQGRFSIADEPPARTGPTATTAVAPLTDNRPTDTERPASATEQQAADSQPPAAEPVPSDRLPNGELAARPPDDGRRSASQPTDSPARSLDRAAAATQIPDRPAVAETEPAGHATPNQQRVQALAAGKPEPATAPLRGPATDSDAPDRPAASAVPTSEQYLATAPTARLQRYISDLQRFDAPAHRTGAEPSPLASPIRPGRAGRGTDRGPEAAAADPLRIEVSIGRVEVRSSPRLPDQPPVAGPQRRRPQPASLEDYLQARSEGRIG
ncbi:MAG: hypothetical protein ABIP57_16910 [Jatrophihabitantaceae bacterium]